MAVQVNEIVALKDYFFRVVERAEHHAPNVNEIIYPLLSFIILIMDEQSEIQFKSCEGAIGNMVWFTSNGQRYAFRYEDNNDSIVIRKGSFQGTLVAKVNNKTTTNDLKQIFNEIRNSERMVMAS